MVSSHTSGTSPDLVAAAGFTAVALDLYDGEYAASGDDAEAARLQRQILRDPDAAAARIAVAVSELRRRGHAKLAVMAFCTGASLSLCGVRPKSGRRGCRVLRDLRGSCG